MADYAISVRTEKFTQNIKKLQGNRATIDLRYRKEGETAYGAFAASDKGIAVYRGKFTG